MRVMSDSSVSQFYERQWGQILAFLEDWNARQSKNDRIYISYDSTNIRSQAGDIDIIEFANAKDDKVSRCFKAV